MIYCQRFKDIYTYIVIVRALDLQRLRWAASLPLNAIHIVAVAAAGVDDKTLRLWAGDALHRQQRVQYFAGLLLGIGNHGDRCCGALQSPSRVRSPRINACKLRNISIGARHKQN